MTDKRTSEDIERSERLFQLLAAEEPPIDIHSDTAPSKTAPRPAAVINKRRGIGRYILLGLGALLLLTIAATVVVFLQSDDTKQDVASSTPVNVVQNPTRVLPTLVPTEVRTTQTPLPSETPTIAPTFESPDAQTELTSNLPAILPTAAVDEIAVALEQPPLQAEESAGVEREVEAFTITGLAGRTQVVTYSVQPGDTLSRIAETFNLDVCTLVWSNPRNRVSPLRPGNVLNILPTDGVFYKVVQNVTIQQIAEQTQVSAYSIIDSPFNQLFGLAPDTILVEGMKIVVPDGNGGDCNIWTAPTTVSSGDGTAGGVAAGGATGGSLWGCSYSGAGGGFPANNPMGSSYKFWQGFSSGHTGVDLSASPGSPVVAAGGGTVAFAGWTDGGYGNAVIIDHGGSYSLYAHLSSINVSCGQSVGALDVIGGVGSTGRSSGPHLHFEIRDSGFNPIDPVYSISGGL